MAASVIIVQHILCCPVRLDLWLDLFIHLQGIIEC
uniref:Uncharacterized protein n=1 Tax=Rhizophora mucronata TaxID=61149 RepID=A0A2P2PTE1_RHIMU